MEKTFLDEMKQKLLQEQGELRKRLRSFAHEEGHNRDDFVASFPNYGPSTDENVAEVAAYEDRIGIEHDLEASLRAVDSALAKMERGEYGRCEQCQELIEPERLRAFPAAKFCVQHQKKEHLRQ